LRMDMIHLGITLISIGFILIFVAVLAWFLSSFGGRARGGGIVMIGPLPIIFGTDKESVKILVLLAVLLIVIMAAIMFMPAMFWRFQP
jgi:uncharacterized protein (TIGR00304 family)